MNIIKINLDIFTTLSIMNKYGKKNSFSQKILWNLKTKSIYLKTDYSLPVIKFFVLYLYLPVHDSHLANTDLPVFFKMLAQWEDTGVPWSVGGADDCYLPGIHPMEGFPFD